MEFHVLPFEKIEGRSAAIYTVFDTESALSAGLKHTGIYKCTSNHTSYTYTYDWEYWLVGSPLDWFKSLLQVESEAQQRTQAKNIPSVSHIDDDWKVPGDVRSHILSPMHTICCILPFNVSLCSFGCFVMAINECSRWRHFLCFRL